MRSASFRCLGDYSVRAVYKTNKYSLKVCADRLHTNYRPSAGCTEGEYGLSHVDTSVALDNVCIGVKVAVGSCRCTLDPRELLECRLYLLGRSAHLNAVAVAVLYRLDNILGTLVRNNLSLIDNDNSLAHRLYLGKNVG